MANEREQGTAEIVAKMSERLALAERHAVNDAAAVLVIPTGKQVVDLRPFEDARLDNPRRRKGLSEHTTLDSFLLHVERTRDAGSAIFAKDSAAAPEFLVIYDYNEQTEHVEYVEVEGASPAKYDTKRTPGLPRFGEHRARYAMPFSDEWLAWMAIGGPDSKWLGQLDFAQALEDRGLDVIPPSDIPSKTATEATALSITPAGPSQLLNLSRGLIVRADRRVGSAVNLNTGEAKITFEEAHAASVNDAPVIVPTGFAISIPVFRDGEAYALLLRLRYRVEGAQIKWKLALHRSDVAFRDAFYDVAKNVKTKTGLPLFYGTPEK